MMVQSSKVFSFTASLVGDWQKMKPETEAVSGRDILEF